MYLLIYEDSSVEKTKEINDDDLASCDDGLLSIIDISDPNNPLDYYKGWNEIKTP